MSTHFTPPFSFSFVFSFLLYLFLFLFQVISPALVTSPSMILCPRICSWSTNRSTNTIAITITITRDWPVATSMRMPATSQIHASPFPPVLAATPPLPWFRLTLFLASIRLLDLSLLRDTCASRRRCAQYCRAIANARQCTVVATFVCDMRSRINMKSRLKLVFFKCGLRTHRMYSCLLYKSLRVNFIVRIQNKFGRFSYIVIIILHHIRRFNILILEFLCLFVM